MLCAFQNCNSQNPLNENPVYAPPEFAVSFHRLLDVVHGDKKLFLVFEYLDRDLKKYMDSVSAGGISLQLVKVINITVVSKNAYSLAAKVEVMFQPATLAKVLLAHNLVINAWLMTTNFHTAGKKDIF